MKLFRPPSACRPTTITYRWAMAFNTPKLFKRYAFSEHESGRIISSIAKNTIISQDITPTVYDLLGMTPLDRQGDSAETEDGVESAAQESAATDTGGRPPSSHTMLGTRGSGMKVGSPTPFTRATPAGYRISPTAGNCSSQHRCSQRRPAAEQPIENESLGAVSSRRRQLPLI